LPERSHDSQRDFKTIVATAVEIHRHLGPGLLESVYQVVLARELTKLGLRVEKEVPIRVVWDNLTFEAGFQADLIVEGMVIVELKSVEKIAPVHKNVLLTYLRLSDKRLGLLLNFGEEVLRDGIHRVVNGLEEPHAGAQGRAVRQTKHSRPFWRRFAIPSLRLCAPA
jgi:GxxExxY protein